MTRANSTATLNNSLINKSRVQIIFSLSVLVDECVASTVNLYVG